MRLFLEGLKLGVATLWNNKLRTTLTLLGHTTGVLTIITLISLIQGINQYISEKVLDQGANLFFVDKFGPGPYSKKQLAERVRRPNLDLEDYEALRDRNETLMSVGASLRTEALVRHRDRQLSQVLVRGSTEDAPFFAHYPIEDGRSLRVDDSRHHRRVAVLGHTIAQELFAGSDPIGEGIRIGNRRYTVVGVLGERGKILGQDTDNFVAVPLTEMMIWVRDRLAFQLEAKPQPGISLEEAEAEAQWILRGSRGLRRQEPSNFEIYSSDAFMRLYESLTGRLFAVLVAVGGISLVVGGIGIMNIMMVSVTERTREIGVRKSLGARRKDVLRQFLLESLVITLSGGLIGVLLGFSVSFWVSAVTGLPARISPSAIMLGLSVSAVVGIFFGVFPAFRAARLDPVMALRYE